MDIVGFFILTLEDFHLMKIILPLTTSLTFPIYCSNSLFVYINSRTFLENRLLLSLPFNLRFNHVPFLETLSSFAVKHNFVRLPSQLSIYILYVLNFKELTFN